MKDALRSSCEDCSVDFHIAPPRRFRRSRDGLLAFAITSCPAACRGAIARELPREPEVMRFDDAVPFPVAAVAPKTTTPIGIADLTPAHSPGSAGEISILDAAIQRDYLSAS